MTMKENGFAGSNNLQLVHAAIRFYAELNDFLPNTMRFRESPIATPAHNTIKHLVESLGVPHTEVDLILVKGVSVDFSYIPHTGDHISVYPVFEAFDISPVIRLRPEPLRQPRFIVDSHLGKLAIYLRMLGFDTLYRPDYEDEEITCLAGQDHRIILTRDRGLLKRNIVTHGLYVHATQPKIQITEIVQRLNLSGSIQPFQRCLECNEILQEADKQTILAFLPPLTRDYYDTFQQCPGCKRIYWQGSHYQKMKKFIEEVVS